MIVTDKGQGKFEVELGPEEQQALAERATKETLPVHAVMQTVVNVGWDAAFSDKEEPE